MMIDPSVLDDLRILDLSQGIAGPLCAKLLGDFGADVIKVEPPGGESGRRLPPFFQDDPDPEKSLTFLTMNLNKRGVCLNLEHPEGVAIFKDLARNVDVIVETFPPGYLASLGLDYASLERENPGLVMTSITPFGQTGPYSSYKGGEIVEYATSGIMSFSGSSDREPLKHGGYPGQYESGLNGTLATLIGVLCRDLTGAGQHVDVSMHEVLASTLVIQQPTYTWMGGVHGRREPQGKLFGNIMPCKDGFFVTQAGPNDWEKIATFFDREELREERFADANQRTANGQELDEIILDATKDRTMAEMFKTASEQFRLLFGVAQTPADLADCPQLEAVGFYQEVEHPVIGRIKVPFRLWNMSATPAQYKRCAPLLGQHNLEVYTEFLNCTEDDVHGLRERGVV